MTSCMHFRNNLAAGMPASTMKELWAHIAVCPTCHKLYEEDLALEYRLRNSFKASEISERLEAGIRMNITHALARENGGRKVMRWVTPVLVAAMIFLFLLAPFPGKLSSVEEVSALAVEDHLKKQDMMFECENPKSASWWFESRLDFMARIPDLEYRGYRFVGGRKCQLGGKDVASLFYEKNGKRISLFILDKCDIGFEMERNLLYFNEIETCRVEIWEDEASLYAMVE